MTFQPKMKCKEIKFVFSSLCLFFFCFQSQTTRKILSESHRAEKCCLAVFCSGMLMTAAPVTPAHTVFISLYTRQQTRGRCLDAPLISKRTVLSGLKCGNEIQSESHLWSVQRGQRVCTKMSYLEILAEMSNNRPKKKRSSGRSAVLGSTSRWQEFATAEPLRLDAIEYQRVSPRGRDLTASSHRSGIPNGLAAFTTPASFPVDAFCSLF